MGCTTSKQARHDLRRSPLPPAIPRSRSFPARCVSDVGGHVVLLASSTLGSLELDKAKPDGAELGKALAWPKVTAPRTPNETPPNEPEAIDVWSLMAGLEGYSPAPTVATPFGRHSFSFPINTSAPSQDFTAASTKVTPLPSPASKNGAKSTAVLYFTTLRGVRDTYEDCCMVRAILQGYRVRVDERDVSMHRAFRDELHGLLCLRYASAKCRRAALPSLFVDGELVGGADEVKRLHEAGELEVRLARCQKATADEVGACGSCGDVRFVLCEVCSGSCKLYVHDGAGAEEEEEEAAAAAGRDFRRCPECNENGIVRCPVCCCSR